MTAELSLQLQRVFLFCFVFLHKVLISGICYSHIKLTNILKADMLEDAVETFSTYRPPAMHQPSETTDRYSIRSSAPSTQATTLGSGLEFQISHIQMELSTLPHHTPIEEINAQRNRPPESAVNWELVNKNRYPHTSARSL